MWLMYSSIDCCLLEAAACFPVSSTGRTLRASVPFLAPRLHPPEQQNHTNSAMTMAATTKTAMAMPMMTGTLVTIGRGTAATVRAVSLPADVSGGVVVSNTAESPSSTNHSVSLPTVTGAP